MNVIVLYWKLTFTLYGSMTAFLYLLQNRVEYLIKWKGWGHKYVLMLIVISCFFGVHHSFLVQCWMEFNSFCAVRIFKNLNRIEYSSYFTIRFETDASIQNF